MMLPKFNYKQCELLIKMPVLHYSNCKSTFEPDTPNIWNENIIQEAEYILETKEMCAIANKHRIMALPSTMSPFISSDTDKATVLYSNTWSSSPQSPFPKQ
jgi:hypothetical protein